MVCKKTRQILYNYFIVKTTSKIKEILVRIHISKRIFTFGEKISSRRALSHDDQWNEMNLSYVHYFSTSRFWAKLNAMLSPPNTLMSKIIYPKEFLLKIKTK